MDRLPDHAHGRRIIYRRVVGVFHLTRISESEPINESLRTLHEDVVDDYAMRIFRKEFYNRLESNRE